MKISLSIDKKRPDPGALPVRAGFMMALETVTVLVEKSHIPDLTPHRFLENDLLWKFFVQGSDYPLTATFLENMGSCDRIAFHLSYKDKFWDLRVNLKKGKKTIGAMLMHFVAESGRLAAASKCRVE